MSVGVMKWRGWSGWGSGREIEREEGELSVTEGGQGLFVAMVIHSFIAEWIGPDLGAGQEDDHRSVPR